MSAGASAHRDQGLELELVPHVGVGPFRFRMPMGQARDAAAGWDVFRVAPAPGAPAQIHLTHDPSGLGVSLGFTKGALSDVEVFRFWQEEAGARVLLDGLDVFRTPSDDLRGRLAERGHAVGEDDGLGFDALPGLDVILAHESGHRHPVDEEGRPLHYDYVLLAERLG
ncbi:hypothetical protein [Streptomyces sp. NPDC094031]|uniref:hypothetical protein n=1 Tax=Streptomyces sp. NPDC094031 TaxID=3155307 RepID=UPI0033241E7C